MAARQRTIQPGNGKGSTCRAIGEPLAADPTAGEDADIVDQARRRPGPTCSRIHAWSLALILTDRSTLLEDIEEACRAAMAILAQLDRVARGRRLPLQHPRQPDHGIERRTDLVARVGEEASIWPG